MSADALLPWLGALRAADRDTLALLATMTHILPWWGRDAAAIVRGGPAVAAFLWTLDFLLLPGGAVEARAAQARALFASLLLAAVWAVAWAVVPLGTYPRGFAAAAATQATVAGLPLGAAMLALGAGGGGDAAGIFLRVVVVAYALARLAIGADGPLRVLAEAVSAVAASLVLVSLAPARVSIAAAIAALADALGLDHRRSPALGRRR